MGTTYHIKYTVDGNQRDVPDVAAMQARVEELLAQIDRSMSTWRDDSLISQFNARADTDWMSVDTDLVAVVAASEHISTASDGAFDLTVKPLVDLWGFGRGGSTGSPPAAGDVAAALTSVGYRQLGWRREPPALRKRSAGVQIEVAAIAPGYAVDRIVETMSSLGVHGGLVELGGEVRAWGTAPGGRRWRVGIERPDAAGGVAISVELRNQSLSTSGSYRNFLKYNGRSYSHEIDPRTGVPAANGTVEVSVVAKTAADADGWSTALMVLGTEAGAAVARREGIAARFVEDVGGTPKVTLVGGFEALAVGRDEPP